ncbi:hydrophobe/amphiphile efflux-1 family RND transporter [Halarcobacter ebronensis]|uniref:Hydrophobe/amphiphile efflux-1 family RND transporter n=1 Tax=Halarcobacter ebronensis TaxID=1462615 RepID=A0A4Q0YGP3_9BACT|nr:multidrug efflux RND transporter permease subunit [Halarcobacter ebronensis]RXJ67941.1 hydrophobe/amphiphile efflux-1 family RND transporter [Halarcobacter ebronensis]
MFSRFFINRPIFATVVSILIILAGLISINILPVKEYPAVTPPQINVSATYPGADAVTLNSTVATVLENEINGVDNLSYMTATASPSGTLSISVVFDVGTDVAQAKVDVNNRVQLALNKLPDEVQRQGISVKERSPDMLKVLAFRSKGQVHDTTYISNYLKINVIDDIKRIKGIGDANVFGEKDYAISVWIDPEKLAFYNLTPDDVTAVINSQNNQYSTGSVGAEPIKNIQPFTYSISTEGRLKSVEEFENIIVRSNGDGSTLKLKDIARIELGTDSINTLGNYNKEPMIPVGIFLSPGANALEVSAALEDKLQELSQKFPEDLEYKIPYDATLFVDESIKEVVKTLFEAIIFVVILIYLFLGNIRATIIPVLAIPVSVIGTFAGLYAAGFSINLLTLFGMILAIGLVVDDAIIVIENVERVLRTKKISVKDATIEAMKELTTPLIAIILVLSAVFIPAALTGGFSGVMYKQFAITIVMAVVISGLVALTLTPALCALFLKEHEPEPIWLIRKFNDFFDWLTILFIVGTKKTIKLWFFSLALFAILLTATISIMKITPSGLVPTEDKGVLLVIVNMMPATSLGESKKITGSIEEQLLANPNVFSTGAITGLDISSYAYKTDAALMFAMLKPWDERPLASQNAQAIAGQLMGQFFMTSKEAFVIPVNPPPIMGMSTTGGFEMWIQDRTGGDLSTLNGYVQEIVSKAQQDPRITSVRTTLNTNVPQYLLTVDREKARSMGINIASIYSVIQQTYGKGYINDFNLYSRTFHVNIQSESQYRETRDNFKNIYVKSSTGNLVPVSELVSLERKVNASIIQRFNMFNAAQITGNPTFGFASSDATNAIEEIAASVLPDGYTISWSGTTFQEKKLQKEGSNTSIYAAVFVFLILAALYESWSIPLAVIISIPFAIFGAALAVYLRGLEADIYFQVGLVTLVGLAAKNAILIVEFAMDKLKAGYSLFDATIEAARLRFRPIVMTSLAFIVGTLPLAISSGAGSSSRHIIGTTVVGGMISAMVIGVLFIPLFFYGVVKIKQKIDSIRGK